MDGELEYPSQFIFLFVRFFAASGESVVTKNDVVTEFKFQTSGTTSVVSFVSFFIQFGWVKACFFFFSPNVDSRGASATVYVGDSFVFNLNLFFVTRVPVACFARSREAKTTRV